MSADSSPANLANPQSFNRYAYVLNDPVNLIDPRGTDAVYVGDYVGPGGINDASDPCAIGTQMNVFAGMMTVAQWDDVHGTPVERRDWQMEAAVTQLGGGVLSWTPANSLSTMFYVQFSAGFLSAAGIAVPADPPVWVVTIEEILKLIAAAPGAAAAAVLALSLAQTGSPGGPSKDDCPSLGQWDKPDQPPNGKAAFPRLKPQRAETSPLVLQALQQGL
jgi:hypothetical protein